MNPSLKDFFEKEKTQVFTPRSVLQYPGNGKDTRAASPRIQHLGCDSGQPAASILGLALVVMLAFIAVQLFVPKYPDQGFITAALEAERSQTDAPYLIPAQNCLRITRY